MLNTRRDRHNYATITSLPFRGALQGVLRKTHEKPSIIAVRPEKSPVFSVFDTMNHIPVLKVTASDVPKSNDFHFAARFFGHSHLRTYSLTFLSRLSSMPCLYVADISSSLSAWPMMNTADG